ncbi:PREDICTED: eukaryotic translation initiation factor 4E-1-like [Fragaria vesca subsp. vesca]|uniref:eukaryotic translation initiation factor 4E-1-like n=1 Tax=Fragaria vesca subsp. vesca TaxID=101020 RepID=UPI0002C2F527|nr:PREDICTED: eukaryotic translation initiation factor 4E-1-like [Fragaria vesca subsp. vesca]
MSTFSKLLRGKEKLEAFLRKYPEIPYAVATVVFSELGFPYILLPEIPAIMRYLRRLWETPTWREVVSSLLQSGNILLFALLYLAFHLLCSMIKKKKLTTWLAVGFLTRRVIKLCPKEFRSEHSWTLWVGNPMANSEQEDWGGSLCPIYTFSTVKGFWSLYNNMHHPSKLTPGYDYYIFKENIEPELEDPACSDGGKWTLTFSTGRSDQSWLHTIQALVQEQFNHRYEICGAVISLRDGQEKIALWTKNAANEAVQVSIGKQWKGFLDSNETIWFTFHEDARQVGSYANDRYTV